MPRSGFAARLTFFTSAAMAFLCVMALAFALSAGRVAARWGDELAGTATIRITAPREQRAAQLAAVLRVAETTPGIREARALDRAERERLLRPWFGPDLPLDELPLPELVALRIDPQHFDARGLSLRLAGEAPGAVLDDHARWRAPLLRAASALRALAWTAIAVIFAATAAMVTLAARAALAANAGVIEVLRLVGASDAYIAGAFVRRFTLRALAGALTGTAIGAGLLALLPRLGDTPLAGLGLSGISWLAPMAIPLAIAIVTRLATSLAARRTLEERP